MSNNEALIGITIFGFVAIFILWIAYKLLSWMFGSNDKVVVTEEPDEELTKASWDVIGYGLAFAILAGWIVI